MLRSFLRRNLLTPVVVLAAIVLVASLTQDGQVAGNLAAAQVLRPEPLPLGTFTDGITAGGRCPEGHTCRSFTVSGCTNVSKPQDGVIAYAPAIGTPRGMVVFFSGGGGTYFWSPNNVAAETLVAELRQEGLAVVQVRWTRAWEAAEPGEIDAGAAHVACRPATAAKWVHDNLYVPLGVPSHGVGQCGFCLTGTSGGASQAAYPLSHYGLEGILDAVVPVSGPTHGAMTKGCLRVPGEDHYWYSGPSTRNIDNTFGYLGPEGPCRDNAEEPYDRAFWIQRWDEESVATQGSDYTHPQTRVHLIVGENDKAMQAHSQDYYERLVGAGSSLAIREVVPGMPHAVTQSTEGMAAMKAALVGSASPPPPPLPAASVSDVSVTEGNAGPTNATFTVSLSAAGTSTVTLNYATADGTATVAGGDYVAANGTLSFAPGERSKTVTVTVNGDAVVESDESFSLNLSGATNATIADSQGTATIRNDDASAPPPSTSVVANGGFESGLSSWMAMSASPVSSPTRTGSGAARLGGNVNVSSGLIQGVTVPTGGRLEAWVRVDGLDTGAGDSLLVQVGSGRAFETVATVTAAMAHGTFLAVSADLSAYAGQTLNLRFLAFNDATMPTTFYVDDVSLVAGDASPPPPPLPAASVSDVSVTEGNAGPTNATFTVSLSAAGTSTVTLNYATADGTATVAGGDYVAANGTLSFAPGERSKTVTVTVNGDAVVESDESFSLNLSGATNATIADSQGTATIRNDDAPPPPTSAVTNGGFESGLDAWTPMSASSVSSPTRTGSGSARLGGSVNVSSVLTQGVTVPAGGRLEAWVAVDGLDTGVGDSLLVQVGSGRVYETVATVTAAMDHRTFLAVSADLSAYAGQAVNLRFLAFNDANMPTTFYVDDVSLVGG